MTDQLDIYPEIFINESKEIYSYLKNIFSIVRSYKHINNELKPLHSKVEQITQTTFDSYVINGPPKFNYSSFATVLFVNNTVQIKKHQPSVDKKIEKIKG